MGLYEVLLFLHVIGAIVWIGVGITGHALLVVADRRREWAFAADLNRAFGWIEAPAGVFGPLLLLASGVGMVLEGAWSFGDTWVVIGLAGVAVALGLGVIVQAPGLRTLAHIVEERGVDDPEALTLARRLNGFMWPELGILLIVVLAMVAKPTGAGSLGFWVGVVAIVAMAAGLSVIDRRGQRLQRSGGTAP